MFPNLNVLDAIIEQVKNKSHHLLEDVYLVATQHLLESTGSLFKTLLDLGLRSNRCFIQGKLYSNSFTVVQGLKELGFYVQPSTCLEGRGQFIQSFRRDIASLWAKVSESIPSNFRGIVIVLDDGGHCLASVPHQLRKQFRFVGIEQTTAGLQLQDKIGNFPIIQVATAAVKKYVEPPMISRAVVAKLLVKLALMSAKTNCGVVGIGNIGTAVAKNLIERGHKVFAYDIDPSHAKSIPGLESCDSVKEVVMKSEYIFGCSGHDITSDLGWIDSLEDCKTFISCSSEDKEFRNLITKKIGHRECIHEVHHLQDLSLKLPHANLTILRGGFPINFDGNLESVPSDEIQVTRGLLLGAVLQAAMCDSLSSQQIKKQVMLDPYLQQFVIKSWLTNHPLKSDEIAERCLDFKWLKEKSDGIFLNCNLMMDTFSDGPEA